jgi:phospholipase C
MSGTVQHVVIFVLENHTTDDYFRSMRAWGANVATDSPAKDQSHDRAGYAKWLHAQQHGTPTPATHTQFDNATVLPYYAYLAATGAFLENHCSGSVTGGAGGAGRRPTWYSPRRLD